MPDPLDSPCVIGLDLGTGGARAMLVSAEGKVLAQGSADLRAGPALETGRHEQDPAAWWTAAKAAIQSVMADFLDAGGQIASVQALSVDGTSGTILGLDRDGRPCTAALMYNDGRAIEQAAQLNDWSGNTGAISASWSLAKMLWLAEHDPTGFERTQVFAHQADYIVTKLTGLMGYSDESNALKSGYDLQARDWPHWIASKSPLAPKLPRVVEPGVPIACLLPTVANDLGLPADLKVVAGATDGTAAFIASGAREVGQDNTTLGTTLVFKRLSRAPVVDPDGLVYSHRLPDQINATSKSERWLPGCASNVGAEWIAQEHPGADLQELDRLASTLLPNEHLAYPLARRGERFPFASSSARGFLMGPTDDQSQCFAARLQGVALVERLGYSVLDHLAPPPNQHERTAVFATGGGSRSDLWLQLRADVTGRTFHRPRHPDSAFGSAILAAANTIHSNLWDAMGLMLELSHSFHPNEIHFAAYDEIYGRFRRTLEQEGHIQPR